MQAAFAGLSKRRPFGMSVATAFGVVTVGDVIVQASAEGAVDLRRSAVPATYSALVAPIYFVFWRWLDARWPGTTLGPVLKKALFNQALTSPPNNAGYIAWCTYWLVPPPSHAANVPVSERVWARLRDELPGIVGTSALAWVPMNILNFMFVPLHHRVLFMSSVNCVWAGWLSHQVNHDGGARGRGGREGAACAADAPLAPVVDAVACARSIS